MADLRFGDFDGDGLTDIFRTVRGQWSVWYGNTRAWTPAQTSSKAISELLFGEFDARARHGRGGGQRSRVVSYSSGATAAVGPAERASSRARSPRRWRPTSTATAGPTSRSATARHGASAATAAAASRSLRRGAPNPPYPPLKRLLIGRFDGGPRAGVMSLGLRRRVVGFGRDARVVFGPGERLLIWPGLGSGEAFRLRSEQNMR